MLTKTPSYAVEVFGREDGPDKEVGSECRACCHDEEDGPRNKKSGHGHMLGEDVAVTVGAFPHEEQRRG